MRYRGLAAAAACLVLWWGPAQAYAPESGPAPSVEDRTQVSGVVSRKGTDLEAYFAITDDAGTVWQCIGLTPALERRLAGLQYQRIRVTGTPAGQRFGVARLRVERIDAP